MEKEEKNYRTEQQDKRGDSAKSAENRLIQPETLQSGVGSVKIFLFSLLGYVLLFNFVSQFSGCGMSMCAILPVIVAGWFFGLLPGICAGLLGLPLNILMYEICGLNWHEILFAHGAGIIGTSGLIGVGALLGYMHDMKKRLNIELSKHKQAEEAVKQHRDKLNATNMNLKGKIDERNRAVDKLKETSDQMEHLIESSLDPIVLADGKGLITKPNRTFLKMSEGRGKFDNQ